MGSDTRALVSAIALVVAAAVVPAAFDKASGFGSVATGLAAFVAIVWIANYRNGKTLQ